MSTGAVIVAAGALLAVVTAFLRRRMPGLVVGAVLALAGAAIGWGGMLLRPDPSTWEIVVAVLALAFLVPAHVRIVLGPFGPRRA